MLTNEKLCPFLWDLGILAKMRDYLGLNFLSEMRDNYTDDFIRVFVLQR